MYKRASSGFTLVEIIVIVIVLGILLSIISVFFNTVQRDARDTKRENDITSLSLLLEKYFDRNGVYPSGCGTTCTTTTPIVYPSAHSITPSTTLTTLSTILAQSPLNTIDPQLSTQTPFIGTGTSISNSAPGYVYRGGATMDPSITNTSTDRTLITFTEVGTSRSCSVVAPFTPPTGVVGGDTSPFLLAYYSESKKAWMIHLGQKGVKAFLNNNSANLCALAS